MFQSRWNHSNSLCHITYTNLIYKWFWAHYFQRMLVGHTPFVTFMNCSDIQYAWQKTDRPSDAFWKQWYTAFRSITNFISHSYLCLIFSIWSLGNLSFPLYLQFCSGFCFLFTFACQWVAGAKWFYGVYGCVRVQENDSNECIFLFNSRCLVCTFTRYFKGKIKTETSYIFECSFCRRLFDSPGRWICVHFVTCIKFNVHGRKR